VARREARRDRFGESTSVRSRHSGWCSRMLGGESRSRLSTLSSTMRPIRPNDPLPRTGDRTGRIQTHGCRDQHQFVEHAVTESPCQNESPSDGKKRDPLAQLLWAGGNDRRANARRQRGRSSRDARDPIPTMRSGHHLGRAGVVGAQLQCTLGPAHDDQVMQQRARLVALQRPQGIVLVERDDACERLRLAPSVQASSRNLELFAGSVERGERLYWSIAFIPATIKENDEAIHAAYWVAFAATGQSISDVFVALRVNAFRRQCTRLTCGAPYAGHVAHAAFHDEGEAFILS